MVERTVTKTSLKALPNHILVCFLLCLVFVGGGVVIVVLQMHFAQFRVLVSHLKRVAI